MHSVRRCTKASEEKIGGEMYDAYREMSRAVGGEEATGCPESKSRLENEGQPRRREKNTTTQEETRQD